MYNPIKSKVQLTDKTKLEEAIIALGYKALSAADIHQQLVGNQFLGGYMGGFQYIIAINTDGSLEGKNNYQHYDIGRWHIDEHTNGLTVRWQYGWDNSTTRIYPVNDEFWMYDTSTRLWRTSLTKRLSKQADIKNYTF